ncbi:hypothetical protein PLANPX_3017 [Lacipirellula parvula]|uniref:Uncharacterized protein n=1 Tax=Lacipirellula parvula TaxID=2650471 RepID=A0A5K7XAG0_9BACT|nr:hypothetical protein PLANPX_3017 [Lacipirellula parvula]
MVSRAIGLDAVTRSANYIQLYSSDKEMLLQSLDYIQRTATQIITALESGQEAVNDHSFFVTDRSKVLV